MCYSETHLTVVVQIEQAVGYLTLDHLRYSETAIEPFRSNHVVQQSIYDLS